MRLRRPSMTTDLIAVMTSPQAFNRAWRALRRDQAVWRPGVRRAEIEPHLIRHLMELRQSLADGSYRPEGVRQFTIAKGDGSRRVLSALCLRDKLAQRAAMEALTPLGEQLFHHDSYGYRPGRNVDMAHRKACERVECGLSWLVDADIKSFFDNIPHRALQRCIKRHVPDKRMQRLLLQWLDAGTYMRGLLEQRRGIPQGAIVSPFLCNLYLHELDRGLAANNLPFVRYADDLLVFAPDQRRATAARDKLGQLLAELNLALHPDKTQIDKSGPKVRFLGKRMPRPPKWPTKA